MIIDARPQKHHPVTMSLELGLWKGLEVMPDTQIRVTWPDGCVSMKPFFAIRAHGKPARCRTTLVPIMVVHREHFR